jgi:predicted Zn-dependent peptidase
VRLDVHRTHKLKTVQVRASFIADLDAGVTRRALIPLVLRRGSRGLPNLKLVNRHLEELYGAGVASGVVKVGEWQVLRFQLEVVNDRFLPGETGVVRRGIEFLRDLVFDPLEVDGGFHPDYVEQEKANLRLSIESLVDDKAAYAHFRCVEEMCPEEPYRLNEQGRIEDIGSIGPIDLFADYRNWVRGAPLRLHVAGDLDVDAVRGEIASVFAVHRTAPVGLRPLPAAVPVGEVREFRERLDVNQAKLVLGFRHGITYADERYEALLVMNGVLGAYSHSKLFRNVREKASLAYSVGSGLERTKGLLFISAGISAESYQRALGIILEEVEALRRGEVAQDEIESTVRTILNQNLMLEDNIDALIEADFVWSLHGRPLDLEAFRRRITAVTRGDIVEVARRLQHDVTYLLHG